MRESDTVGTGGGRGGSRRRKKTGKVKEEEDQVGGVGWGKEGSQTQRMTKNK